MDNKYRYDNQAIIDITKPPYCADNTGRTDCTACLQQAVDDVLRMNIEGLERTKQKLLDIPDSDAAISFEIRKKKNKLYVIFPEELEKTKILYFPKGTYLVSDTVSYTLENLTNIYAGKPYMEMNRQIHFKGENKEQTIIKLKDNCKGFEYGSQKPVVSFMKAEKSNIAMTNSFEDITIDIGEGNPGAVGLVFFGNNSGTVKNIRIISSDLSHRGYAGLEIKHEIISGCYIKNVEVDGFDYGIRAIPMRNYMVLETISLKNQKKAGIFIENAIISIRCLYSENIVPGVRITGQQAHLVLVDSKIFGGNQTEAAVNCSLGSLFIRNVLTQGYEAAVVYAQKKVIEDEYIQEYISDKVYSAFITKNVSEPIMVEDTPEVPWPDDPNEWISVNDFGAQGDGITDDTYSIAKAFASGSKYIFFQPGKYLVSDSIEVPESVVRINFMYCDFVAEEKLKCKRNHGLFVITGNNGIVMLEDVFTWEKFYGYIRFIEHAGKRTLIMSDLHTQTAAMYFNSIEGGRVFIEDCACTIGGDPYREVPAFSFTGQSVWARQINPERSFCEVLNDHSSLWVLGFKTENYGTSFKTINRGHTEVLGGTISIGTNKDLPAIINTDSTVSIVASTNGYSKDQFFPIAVVEIQHGEKRILKNDIFPIRFLNNYLIPLYIGRFQEAPQ